MIENINYNSTSTCALFIHYTNQLCKHHPINHQGHAPYNYAVALDSAIQQFLHGIEWLKVGFRSFSKIRSPIATFIRSGMTAKYLNNYVLAE